MRRRRPGRRNPAICRGETGQADPGVTLRSNQGCRAFALYRAARNAGGHDQGVLR